MLPIARLLMIVGIGLLAAGGLVYLAARLGVIPGRLPSDIRLHSGSTTLIIALGSSLLLSLILTVVLNIIVRWLK